MISEIASRLVKVLPRRNHMKLLPYISRLLVVMLTTSNLQTNLPAVVDF